MTSVFNKIAQKYRIAKRILLRLYKDILWENDLVTVILEHLDYFLQLEGKRSSFGTAAYEISKIEKPLSTMRHELRKIRGIGETTEKIIVEILESRTSSYYTTLAS